MLNLNEREWTAFPIDQIFEIKPGKRLTKSDMQQGKRPFIGATEYGNGITNWVSNTNASLDGEILGVNYNGSVVETFYHPYECIFSDDVKRFRLKKANGNRWVYLFLKTTIIQQKSKYAYGYKFNEQRMNKQSILLPINDDGKPDWTFMEDYTRERENDLLAKYKRYILDKYILPNATIIMPLEQTNWREFKLENLFMLERGSLQSLSSSVISMGVIDYVGATSNNNGNVGFLSDKFVQYVREGNCLVFINTGEGSVGDAVYKSNKFIPSNNVTVGRSANLNVYTGNFIVTVINNQSYRYNYGYIRNEQRLRNEILLLPANSDGTPDWAYMEQYVHSQENKLIQEYKENVLAKISNETSSQFINGERERGEKQARRDDGGK